MNDKEENICGETIEINGKIYGKKVDLLNLQLVHVGGDVKIADGYFAIDFEDWSSKFKKKHLFRVHIKDAIKLKSMIDNLLYDALTEPEPEETTSHKE